MHLDGEILRKVRVNILHLSQEEAAERLAVGRATVQRWERGENSPQPCHRRKIEEVYGDGLCKLGVDLDAALPSGKDDIPLAASVEQGTSVLVALVVSDSSSILAVPDEPQMFITSHMTTHLWHLAHMPHQTCDDKRRHIRQAIKEFDTMNTTNKNYQITRREALCSLATLPMITLGLTIPGSTVQSAQYGTVLAHCAASVEACWALHKSNDAGDVRLAFESASKYLPILVTIARNSAQHRKEALDLATRYALVKTYLGRHCTDPMETIQYAKDAVALSKETEDISLQLSAYSKLAWTYFFNKKYTPALATAQEAEAHLQQYSRLPHAQPLHPCIYGGTYSTLALMQAQSGRAPDEAVGKATEVDPGNQSYAFMDFRKSSRLIGLGWTYCYHGDQTKAMEILEQRIDPQTLALKMPQSETGRLETLNVMALSSLRAPERDMEKTIHFWIPAIEGARAFQNEQRFNEAVATYEFMEFVWPGEQRITDLRDMIVHW